MAAKSFPFRSVAGDRKYSAEDWADYFAQFIGNGVFLSSADKLKVAAGEGMKLKVGKGAGFIAGRMYLQTEDTNVTLDIADGVLSRIDRIVLRCDYTNRLITIAVKKGSYSEKPTAPDLTRDADAYELALADIYVAAGVVSITAASITDQRLNKELCGAVTGLVEQADTTGIFNQFQAYLQEFKQASREEFEMWFDEIRGVLSEDAAGNLLIKMDDLQEEQEEIKERLTNVEEGGGADTSTVRYVSDENDANFDWVQVLTAGGKWVNAQRAYTQRYELYVAQNNGAEFAPYAGGTTVYAPGEILEPTVSFANNMTIEIKAKPNANGVGLGCVISKLIDLSRYKTIKLHHFSTNLGTSNINQVNLFVTQYKASKMEPIVFECLHTNKLNTDADAFIDISELNGEYYIGIEVQAYYEDTTKCVINLYME